MVFQYPFNFQNFSGHLTQRTLIKKDLIYGFASVFS